MLFSKKKPDTIPDKNITENVVTDQVFVPKSPSESATPKTLSAPTSAGKESETEVNIGNNPVINSPLLNAPPAPDLEKNTTAIPIMDTVTENKSLGKVPVADAYPPQNPEENQPSISADSPLDLGGKVPELCAEEIRFLTKIFKYGCLQTPPTGLSECLRSLLDKVKIQQEEVWFHTQKSLEIYARHCQIRIAEVRKKVFLKSAVTMSELPLILEQNNLLLTLEQTNKYQLWDWISAYNPRKKRLLKIQIGGKHRCLTPHLVVVLKGKTGKCGLIFDTISTAYEAFSPGERCVYYSEMLLSYHTWLNSENLEKWLKKRQIYVAPLHIGIAILLAENADNLIGDLLEICENLDIKAPIYFTDKPSFLVKPLAWYSHVDQEKYPQFLTIRNQK